MTVSRMLKVQILGHSSIKGDLKSFLRESGSIEVTEVSVQEWESAFDEETVRELTRLKELTDASIEFTEEYSEQRSFFERLSKGRLGISTEESERLVRDIDVADMWRQCNELQNVIRGNRDELARSRELVRSLEPWRPIGTALETLSTEGFVTQLWNIPEKQVEAGIDRLHGHFPYAHFEEVSRGGGYRHVAVILPESDGDPATHELKAIGAHRSDFKNISGTPDEIIQAQRMRWTELEHEIDEAEGRARTLAAERDKLLVISDHLGERIGLMQVERDLFRTDSTFLLEGWINAIDRRRLEKGLAERFEEIELFFRQPFENENPPILLANRTAFRPFEFITTLYGRPVYREVDPTPLLAPFFILFFALCLTDAGYGLTLSAVAAVILIKFKPAGGAGRLIRVLFMGGLVTALVGFVTGGVFGINADSFPAFIRQFIFINPLEEPMKMLNIAFLMGLVHILFGMGIRMVANIRAGLLWDGIFDDLLWILFLTALAPLGYSAILGGVIPPQLTFWCTRAALVFAAAIFLTGGRKQKNIVAKGFKGLIGFYDVVGYFGDVLSYARLLALGLATSAIALAVNGIAGMVLGLPYYIGYVAALLVLVLGHGFNLAVNTLGAFVHSGRLQYLEFFSKFFTGGGREFQPFQSERRYTVLKERKNS
ncbi:MAG: V-type ATP synthase subunit I [bacterium]|nr:MAG: V-type ATP synthase subunit I [bacterium]